MNTRRSLQKTERWQIVLEPWCWPYGEDEAPYGVGYIDTYQKEPWEIAAEREKWERIEAEIFRQQAERMAERRKKKS